MKHHFIILFSLFDQATTEKLNKNNIKKNELGALSNLNRVSPIPIIIYIVVIVLKR